MMCSLEFPNISSNWKIHGNEKHLFLTHIDCRQITFASGFVLLLLLVAGKKEIHHYQEHKALFHSTY